MGYSQILRLSLWLLCAFCVVFGARLWLVAEFASPMPLWDQWDAQAPVFTAWMNGDLSWQTLFADHNQHRHVFNRLFTLLLFIVNDAQWDTVLEMSVSAALAGCTVVFLLFILKEYFQVQRNLFLSLMVVFLWAVPFAWVNILWGFQIAWQWMLLLTLIAFWGALLHQYTKWQWWLGIVCGFLAFFNYVSGFFALLVIAVIAGYQFFYLPEQAEKKSSLITVLTALILIGICIALIGAVPEYSLLKDNPARNINEFITAFLKALAFPWVRRPALSLLLWLPFLVFFIVIIRQKKTLSPKVCLILALGFWSLLQITALAYARANAINFPSARHMDIFYFGLLANALSLFYLLLFCYKKALKNSKKIKGFTILWGILIMVGTVSLVGNTIVFITKKPEITQVQTVDLKKYLASNDPSVFKEPPYIPLPSIQYFTHILNNKALLSSLPSYLKPPVVPKIGLSGFYPNGLENKIFMKDKLLTLGSYSTSLKQAQLGKLQLQGQPTTLPYLRLSVFSDNPQADGLHVSLRLQGEETPPQIIELSMGQAHVWQDITLPMPASPYEIIVEDNSDKHWIAVGLPDALGRATVYNQKLLPYAAYIFTIGMIGFLLLTLLFRFSKHP